MTRLLALVFVCLSTLPGRAETLETVEVVPGVYAIVGPLGQRDPANLGNNATFGLVVTDDGAVLIDPGGSNRGAAELDAAVRTITDSAVVTVIDTGGQDHRWLGNGYWKARGATVIASAAAVSDQAARASMQMSMLAALIGPDGLDGTEPVQADLSFEDRYTFSLGGVDFELIRAPGHTPGDTIVWLPGPGVAFAGDLVFTERLLGVMEYSSSREWVESFAAMAALSPRQVVPGHGHPTDLATATRDTYDYLVNLRAGIAGLIESGGSAIDAPSVDQSAFSGLINFDTLAGRNAQEVFSQMEWE